MIHHTTKIGHRLVANKTFIGQMAGVYPKLSLVKMVRRDVITISSATSNTATIPAVDVANSELRFLGCTTSSDSADQLARVELTNATSVTAIRYNASADVTTVSFEVIEYFPGVIKSVQRNASAVPSNPTNITITAVADMTKTAVSLLGWRTNDALVATTEMPRGRLTSTTNLQLALVTAANVELGWQVTEWW
jgi:hypothetical protein